MQSFSAMEENITLSDIDGGDVIRTSRIGIGFDLLRIYYHANVDLSTLHWARIDITLLCFYIIILYIDNPLISLALASLITSFG